MQDLKEDYKYGIRVLWVTIAFNIFLSIIKVAVGIIGKSSALVADGIHSVSDVVTTFLAMAGVKISNKEADEEHPYGHERFEAVFTKLLSLFLIGTAFFIGYNSFKVIVNETYVKPDIITTYAAILSIFTKEFMYWYTIKAADKLNSLSMKADAWHHRSDAISSVIALVGIVGTRMGYQSLDAVSGIIVSIFIGKLGIDFYFQAVKALTDESISEEHISKIKEITLSVKQVRSVFEIKTRVFGNKYYADIIIGVDPEKRVRDAYEISQRVHDEIEYAFPDCKHCSVQIKPSDE